jgi:hypothetical protein
MHTGQKIIGRLGLSPGERGDLCAAHHTCPDVFLLENGDFAVIGRDITSDILSGLPSDAGCGANERIVLLPRSVLVAAKGGIPDP